jgi:hypothetical protein
MPIPQEEMAQLIFDVLSGKGHEIRMYDEKGNQVFDPGKANRLWSNNQKIMVTLGYTKGKPPKPLVTFYTSDVTDRKQFDDIKFTLKRHNPWDFSFDTEHFARSLEPKHFKHMNVTEHQHWSGSTRTSYFPINGVLVVIKHSKPWNKQTIDQAQRWRRIKQVMLHTPTGERFRFPINHVLGAKAMAQHLSQQNQMHDKDGALIQSLSRTLQTLGNLHRRAKKLGAEDLLLELFTTRARVAKLLKEISESRTYAAAVQGAKQILRDWKSPKAPTQSIQSTPATFKEARELMSWFNSFGPSLAEDKGLEAQVQTAWEASNHNKYETLDYLKRNVPGWQSRFEADPQAVTNELEEIISTLENFGK